MLASLALEGGGFYSLYKYMDIKSLRKRAGYTQLELSELVGVSRSMVSLYEMGAAEPSVKVLVKLAAIFKIDLNEMKRPAQGQVPSTPVEPVEKPVKRQAETLMRRIEKKQAELAKMLAELAELLRQGSL